MEATNETVREVCADISYLTGDLADRILAAHEREMAAKDAEITRLKAALKPVMECDLTDVNATLNCILMSSHNAVREAQRVMREGCNDACLIAAAPELLAFAAAYYERHKRNAVKVNPSNGDKYQDGLMVMCKQALVKAGMMDESEVWKEEE